jgi:hypothetical protein
MFPLLATNHDPEDCFYKTEKCRKCEQIGHIYRACKSDVAKPKNLHSLGEDGSSQGACYDEYDLYSVKARSVVKPVWVEPRVEDTTLRMELDTGSAVSVMQMSEFKSYFGDWELEPTKKVLKTYSGRKSVRLEWHR